MHDEKDIWIFHVFLAKCLLLLKSVLTKIISKMVSVLPPGAGFDYPPAYFHGNGHHGGGHHPRLMSASKQNNIHLRSQSMPEAVYLAQQQQQQLTHQLTQQHAAGQHQQQQHQIMGVKTRGRHPSGQTASKQPQMAVVSLRRSHTNVADFGAVRRTYAVSKPRYWNETPAGAVTASELTGMFGARSRSNIAALGLNPEAVYRPSMPRNGLPSRSGISRASSFYHHREHPLQTARSMGFLASAPNSRSSLALPSCVTSSQSCKDVSQPLHVDCSVEYDLGNQPKIPKDSAPLLIIHPAYQQLEQQQEQQLNAAGPAYRFHPYNNQQRYGKLVLEFLLKLQKNTNLKTNPFLSNFKKREITSNLAKNLKHHFKK